jgi:hypothetical protein
MKKLHPYSLRLDDIRDTLLNARAKALGITKADLMRRLIDTLAADQPLSNTGQKPPRRRRP